MNVLLLSPYPGSVAAAIAAAGDDVVVSDDPIAADGLRARGVDAIVSYGYRRIIREPVLSAFAGRVINLHISHLPWNRGAHPNLFSWLDRTPKGVTIHQIDAGIDTGAILVQEETAFGADETLATSYHKLRSHIEDLFARSWRAIRAGALAPQPQPGGGSHHFARDGEPILAALSDGFNTPVAVVERLGQAYSRA